MITLADAEAVYDDLRVIAHALFNREKPGQTIQATALLHDVFLVLFNSPKEITFKDEQHLINTFRLVMRRLLIDRSRRRRLPNNGSELEPGMNIPLTTEFGNARVEEVSMAIEKLRKELPLYADVVEFKCCCSLTEDQISYIMGVGEATVRRYWQSARAWLHTELGSQHSAEK